MKATDKIALLVSGKVTLKDIQALEAQEAAEAKAEAEQKKEEIKEPEEKEPDYKALYEELIKAQQEDKKEPEKQEPDYKAMYEAEAAKVTALQKDNINKNLKKEEEVKSIEDIMISAYSHS